MIRTTTLLDGTTVQWQYRNDDPNRPGGQHTNGPQDLWIRFYSTNAPTEWFRTRAYYSRCLARDLNSLHSIKDVAEYLHLDGVRL